MYIKINNGKVEKYPYSIDELKLDYTNTSFPSDMSEELLNEYNVYAVELTTPPVVTNSEIIVEGEPVKINGVWKQTWEVKTDTIANQILRIQAARKSEYPPIEDYIDGVVKGDEEQIASYIKACLDVKAKYPKP